MNTTPQVTPQQLGIQQFVGKKINLLEVPNLLHVPEQFHGLYTELRKCNLIKSFSQELHEKHIELTIHLREGEVCNYIVISRIAHLFRQYRAIISDRHDHLTVELYNTKRP